ncbi:hypothetical protein [Pseudonocardia halophobica]|nr:hypothetical protein [Pseudonocardia halophobica]
MINTPPPGRPCVIGVCVRQRQPDQQQVHTISDHQLLSAHCEVQPTP